jgi:hypothetical protein
MNKLILLIPSISWGLSSLFSVAYSQPSLFLKTKTSVIENSEKHPNWLAFKVKKSIPPTGENQNWGNIGLPDVPLEGQVPVFSKGLVFQVFVRDPNPKGENKDGAGVNTVDIVILDSKGKQVHERTEKQAGYCPFGGGEPDCKVLDFAQSGNKWPDTRLQIENVEHRVQITINLKDGSNFIWNFNFKIQR